MRSRVPGSTGCFALGNEEKLELQEKTPTALWWGWELHSEPMALPLLYVCPHPPQKHSQGAHTIFKL